MKTIALALAALLLWLTHHVHAGEPPPGCCLGGSHPAANCKTCEYCYYCGHHGRWGERPENSATCVVCEKARAMERAKKKATQP